MVIFFLKCLALAVTNLTTMLEAEKNLSMWG